MGEFCSNPGNKEKGLSLGGEIWWSRMGRFEMNISDGMINLSGELDMEIGVLGYLEVLSDTDWFQTLLDMQTIYVSMH